MEIKWLAAIAAWLAVGGAVTACAFAWGLGGRWTVMAIGGVGFLCAAIASANIGASNSMKISYTDSPKGDTVRDDAR